MSLSCGIVEVCLCLKIINSLGLMDKLRIVSGNMCVYVFMCWCVLANNFWLPHKQKNECTIALLSIFNTNAC